MLSVEAAEKTRKPLEEILAENENNINRELEEFEALMAEAKKRQTSEKEEDLGGYMKGKILTNEITEDDTDDLVEKKEYDNSELHKKGKLLNLDLEAANENKKNKINDEEDNPEDKPHEGQVDQINSNMFGENGPTDKINDKMIVDLESNGPIKLKTLDMFEIDPKLKSEDENANKIDKNTKIKLEEVENEDLSSKDKNQPTKNEEKKTREKSLTLQLEAAESKEEKNEADEDYREITTRRIKLLEAIKEKEAKEQNENAPEEESNIGFKKLNQTELNLDKSKDDKSNQRKVDKIDSHYRGGAAKKIDDNWDNLGDTNRDINVQVEKKQRQADVTSDRQDSKDYGETTIDYRKLKAELSTNAPLFSKTIVSWS